MNWLGFLKTLGIGGGIGFLIGLALVGYIEPTTTGGALLLIGIFVVVGFIVSESVRLARAGRKR